VEHIEEMRQRVLREKIQKMLQLESDLQHKIKEFDLKLESLVPVKNSAIELLVNRKMKPHCHDLVKWLKSLSIFLPYFFYLGLTTQKEV